MPDPLAHIFAEDFAHEAFLRPLVGRVSNELGKSVEIGIISARGGHPRVLEELTLYRTTVQKGLLERTPDLIVIASDSNCEPYAKSRKVLEETAGPVLMSRGVIACPDPHIERWYMSDPQSFYEVVGKEPRIGKKKCDRDRYKSILIETLGQAGIPTTLGGAEIAPDLVEAMDFYRAGKTEKSLKHFLDGLRSAIQRLP